MEKLPYVARPVETNDETWNTLTPEQRPQYTALMATIPQVKTDVWEGNPGEQLRFVGTRVE